MSNTGFDPFKVKPGSKGFGYINIVDTVAISFDMPLCVVNGEKEGPTLAVTGGLYPTEYYGIEAASRLYQMLDPKKLKGRFIAVPCVNMPALQFRLPWLTMRSSSYTPFDGLNVNSCFPGDPNGRPTQVLAHKLYQILSKANYQIRNSRILVFLFSRLNLVDLLGKHPPNKCSFHFKSKG